MVSEKMRSIYYCADEHSVFPGLSKEVVCSLEDSLLSKVDLVIATSKNLFDRKSEKHANIHLIPHGVDFQHFSKASHPETDGARRHQTQFSKTDYWILWSYSRSHRF